ncbi:MAG: sugar phosphate isomerase/epimerase [Clostridia bacterium]|nr:sugar phosphate isomerase/epimerase [Clostridia bacterium]
MKLAVQLYSLRHHMENGENFLDILKKVKEIGFDGVEFAGFHGYTAEELKKTLDELGLVAVGAHMGLDDFREENLKDTLEFGKTIGAKTLGIGGADTKTETALNEVISVLGEANKKAAEDGIKVYFHNHTEEFKEPLFNTVPGTVFERLSAACYMQIDTYWSFHAGKENYSLISEYKDKIPHLHIKDGIDGHPMALGEGNNDLATVVKAAKDNGIQWLVLENDDPTPDGISDITRSMAWLKANV